MSRAGLGREPHKVAGSTAVPFPRPDGPPGLQRPRAPHRGAPHRRPALGAGPGARAGEPRSGAAARGGGGQVVIGWAARAARGREQKSAAAGGPRSRRSRPPGAGSVLGEDAPTARRAAGRRAPFLGESRPRPWSRGPARQGRRERAGAERASAGPRARPRPEEGSGEGKSDKTELVFPKWCDKACH